MHALINDMVIKWIKWKEEEEGGKGLKGNFM
jgi:hypothetical protein